MHIKKRPCHSHKMQVAIKNYKLSTNRLKAAFPMLLRLKTPACFKMLANTCPTSSLSKFPIFSRLNTWYFSTSCFAHSLCFWTSGSAAIFSRLFSSSRSYPRRSSSSLRRPGRTASSRKSDTLALEALEESGRYLGLAIANIINIITPSRSS